ncbi:hypothetical protein L7F22_022455 [Adiantum nelumboides]|nr:hypothetical protein [Adiantum nelumboides]
MLGFGKKLFYRRRKSAVEQSKMVEWEELEQERLVVEATKEAKRLKLEVAVRKEESQATRALIGTLAIRPQSSFKTGLRQVGVKDSGGNDKEPILMRGESGLPPLNYQIQAKRQLRQGAQATVIYVNPTSKNLGYPSRFYASNRAFCFFCDRPVWLEDRRNRSPFCSICGSGNYKLKPLAAIQVAHFLLQEFSTSASSSSSDSDSDIELPEDFRKKYSKLWSIPKLDLEQTT